MNGICAIKGCVPGVIILQGRLVIARCQRCSDLMTSLIDNVTGKEVWVPGNYAVLPAQTIWIASGAMAEEQECRTNFALAGISPDRIRSLDKPGWLKVVGKGRIFLCGSWYSRENIVEDPLFATLINRQSI